MIDFLMGFAVGVLSILGALSILASILVAWARDTTRGWLGG